MLVKVPVVDVQAFGEVVLRVWTRAHGGVEEVAVVRLAFSDSERHSAGGRDVAVQDVDDRVACLLAREEAVDDGGNIGMLDPLIHSSDAGRVNHDDGVRAVGRNILHKLVAELILQGESIESLARVA